MELIYTLIGAILGAVGMAYRVSRKTGVPLRAVILRGDLGEERSTVQRADPGEER